MSSSMSDGALVSCADVSRSYRSGETMLHALSGVSCSVWPGQQIAITGSSGSGKSTLLHLLAGLDAPTAGTISWPQFAVGAPYRTPGLVGLVFQAPSLLPPLTAWENVALPLQLSGVPEPEAESRAMAALAGLGLQSLAGQLPEELSGGQAQRVAAARVLAAAPKLILADEPTGQLDRTTGGQLIGLLTAAARDLGSALVVSTHDPLVAAQLPVHWQVTDGRLTSTTSPGPHAADALTGQPAPR